MAGVEHFAFLCEHGHTIPLPLQMLHQVALDLAGQSNADELIAVLCDRCTRVQNYNLPKTKPDPHWGYSVFLPTLSGWVYEGWLECEDQTCKIRLAIFLKDKLTMIPEDWKAYAKTWTWDVRCPKCERPILKPE